MNAEQIKAMLDESALPVAYSHFDCPKKPPFICYLMPESTAYFADRGLRFLVHTVRVELYACKKDARLERRLEGLLSRQGLAFVRSQDYISSERLYRTTYEFETEEAYGENNCEGGLCAD